MEVGETLEECAHREVQEKGLKNPLKAATCLDSIESINKQSAYHYVLRFRGHCLGKSEPLPASESLQPLLADIAGLSS